MADNDEKKIIKSDYVGGSQFNILDYFIRSTIRGLVNTALPVVVTGVEGNGTNGGAGYVSAKPLLMAREVRPLVNQSGIWLLIFRSGGKQS